MDSFSGLLYRRACLLIACVLLQIAVHALLRSDSYRRLRASRKIALALLCTQGMAFFFPVLLREVDLIPCLLRSPVRAAQVEAIAEGAGIALGPAAASALCFRLLPRVKNAGRAGTVISIIPIIAYIFLGVRAYRLGLSFTALLYAFGTAYGLFMLVVSMREHRASSAR